jgi:putative transposase
VSGHTFYRRRSKYGGMEVIEAKRLKQVEDENRELKQMVADLGAGTCALKAALGIKR